MSTHGLQRVIVEHVTPEIDAGRFYIKRVAGETVEVEADVFGDGHDLVRGRVLYRHEEEKDWQFAEMSLINNDRFTATFATPKQGFYLYTVTGWMDHALSWHHGFVKKYEDGQDMAVALLIGANFLEGMLKRATKTAAEAIKKIIKSFRDKKQYTAAVEQALGEQVMHFIHEYPDTANATTYSRELKVYVERAAAGFSSWYSFFPRSAARDVGKHGTFKDCEALLPRIAEFGFDVLYFPPIH